MATVNIDGFGLYYEDYGEGEPVVFAHGVGGNHASWYNQVVAFREQYRAIVFDHRGFGNSRDVAGGPGRSRFVEDLRALLDHLGIEKTVLVAQSMGGGTCTGFTAKYPERVRALVLADTVLGMKLPEAIAAENAVIRDANESLGQLERVLGVKTRENEPELTQLYAQIASFNMVNRHTAGGEFGPGVTPEDLAATGVPILLIVGSDDVLAQPQIISAVHKLMPGADLVEVPDAGHSVYFEAPAAFNEAVFAFLERAGVPGRRQTASAT